ncbi:AraC family transcriptional regulator [Piscinibacter gummiphilus]|uniref:AraC family transcriptional regulator n=1 Tax=Piscinibacter gummiphilus TaxID=946333 RepID=A0A1W6LER9_9BURK|nr:AraC family transcriptional regulator [Piscinibacter gummiphilus]ARN22716.1 AraC family transcriptional regulator [Piscinibacter gummiphilus]ATU67413.1 AraC family transcriptional regulator [Piscinibacter gummiphilus]GLS97770.1 transcriptional regulator [Piscinibacter gummiphilus]
MVDPLAEVVSLLQPTAPFSKLVVASAPWAVRRADTGRPFYFVVLEGGCRLHVDGPSGGASIPLDGGDFVLIPAARGFATSSRDREPPREGEAVTTPIAPMPGGARVGDPNGPVDARLLVGHCVFGSPDAALLVSLLPQWIHVRGDHRLSMLVQLVGEESRADRPARDIVLARLLEVLLIEALRSAAGTAGSAGLVRGLADSRLALALRCMHERPGAPWTIDELAREAAMSRSAFFERFSRTVGVAPMAYLLAWRMALAKQLLRQRELAIADIAERVGYSTVSTFGVAFTRHAGMPPGRYARTAAGDPGEAPAAA